jgi:hypothetical protein
MAFVLARSLIEKVEFKKEVGYKKKLDEHGQGNSKKNERNLDDLEKRGNQKGKSDNRITESKARQREALHCARA